MKKFIVILLVVFAVGCAKKYTKPVEETMPAEETSIEETGTLEREEVVEESVFVPAEDSISESELSAEDLAKSIFKDVLFDYDKSDIRPDARPALNAVSAFLNNNKDINIVIEGHCDDRGTNEYNLALGEKRAKAAKNYLASQGISPARMIVITFGEEKPVCTNQNERCWQQNRRAHFVSVQSRFR